jgi:ACS family sodium-dependent inorganic phosphate cotransporter
MRKRIILAILLWACNICLYLARTCMSVAVLSMYGDDKIEGRLLSAFYWGYAVSQTPLGMLAQRINAQHLLMLAVLVWSASSVGVALVGNSPEAVPAIFALRVLVGMAEAANYPCQMQLLSVWAPYKERSRFWSFAATGEALGTIVALGVGPALVHAYGWRSIFFACAASGGVWALLFGLLAASHPEKHPGISATELTHIQASRPPRPPPVFTPFWRILTNRPFWATIVTHCAYNWGYYVGLSWVSKFFNSKYDADLAQLGLLSIAPYIALLIATCLSGIVADGLENGCGASATCARKVVNSIGMVGGALGFALLAIVCGPPGRLPRSQAYVGAGCLSVAIGLGGFAVGAGYWANFVDLSPRHSQVLLAISNSFASVPGIIGVSLTGSLLSSTGDDWRIIFLIAGAVEFGGALIFIAFAEAAEQQFDDDAGPRGCMWRSSRRSRQAFLAGSTSRSVKLLDEHEGMYGDVADCAHMPWEADEQDPEPPHYSAAAAAARAAAARNTDREDPERDSRMSVS